jgi:hypothetical protein
MAAQSVPYEDKLAVEAWLDKDHPFYYPNSATDISEKPDNNDMHGHQWDKKAADVKLATIAK